MDFQLIKYVSLCDVIYHKCQGHWCLCAYSIQIAKEPLAELVRWSE
jgi:hypothetical protein